MPGNHEYCGHRIEWLTDELLARANVLGIHFLDNQVFELGGVRFIGSTLWSDFALYGDDTPSATNAMDLARACINDFRVIRNRDDVFSPEQSATLHRIARTFLSNALDQPSDGKTCVVTHHSPSSRCVPPKYEDDFLNAAFASRLDDLIAQVDGAWIFGHTHTSVDCQVGTCRLACNPRGYPIRRFGGFENTAFDPHKIVVIEAPSHPGEESSRRLTA